MVVYVDEAIWPWRGRRWAHLVADEAEELHRFAERLGLRRAWFQHRPGRPWRDHYDIPAELRNRAVALGARPVGSRELVRILAARREQASSGMTGDPAAAAPEPQD